MNNFIPNNHDQNFSIKLKMNNEECEPHLFGYYYDAGLQHNDDNDNFVDFIDLLKYDTTIAFEITNH